MAEKTPEQQQAQIESLRLNVQNLYAVSSAYARALGALSVVDDPEISALVEQRLAAAKAARDEAVAQYAAAKGGAK